MKTSIIILTYNSQKYVEKLINSILEFNKNEDFEIILVDNNSQDETVLFVKRKYDKVKIYETSANLGFAKGINYGAERARGEFLLFVNPDSVWNNGSISDFFPIFKMNEKIGIVGGKMVTESGKIEKSVSKFYGFWTSLATALGLDEAFQIRSSPSTNQKVDSVSGGFMILKREVFEKLSGFDEHYFMYLEDSDLCFRAKKRGILTYFTPDVVLTHQGQGSSDKAFAFKNIIQGILYFQKNHVNYLSYLVIKLAFYLKAITLVLIGKILNNKTLVDNYVGILKIDS